MLVILWSVQFKLELMSFLMIKTTLNSEVTVIEMCLFVCSTKLHIKDAILASKFSLW